MIISKKTLALTALSAVFALSAGTASAWCGGNGMYQRGPGCAWQQGNAQVPPCVQGGPRAYGPNCVYGVRPDCPLAGQPLNPRGPQARGPQARGPQAIGPQARGANYEQRKVYLRGLLNLTDAQRPAFDAYIAAADAVHQFGRKNPPSLSPEATRQDLLNARIEQQKARLAALEKVAQARAELVKVLTPEQVSALDSFESRRAHARRGNAPRRALAQTQPRTL